MTWWTESSSLEMQLLLLAFALCALIGLERQFKQKAAGFRTHILVGTGAAAFTLISTFGFETIANGDVTLDHSRIAAQIITGIGFIGAGVIFTGKNSVRGLTTAATIWVAAAVGMAAGSGMVSLAIFLTFLHLTSLMVLGPLFRRFPTRDRNRILRITYIDGQGVLRRVLSTATDLGFSAFILATSRDKDTDLVTLDVRFKGRQPLRDLVPQLDDVNGVRSIEVRSEEDDEEEDSAA